MHDMTHKKPLGTKPRSYPSLLLLSHAGVCWGCSSPACMGSGETLE
jgi:hypothetical protein